MFARRSRLCYTFPQDSGATVAVPASRGDRRLIANRTIQIGITELADIPPGRVRTWFVPDVVDAVAQLASPLGPPPDRPLLAVSWPRGVNLDRAIAHVTRALAGVALARWPDWYGETAAFQEGAVTPEIDNRAIDALGAVRPSLNRAWAQRAIRHCRENRRPAIVGIPHAVQVRQLMLALAEPDLVILLALEDLAAGPADLLCFAKAADWFAAESGVRVAAFVPLAFSVAPELDAISYGAVRPTEYTAMPVPGPAPEQPPDPAGAIRPSGPVTLSPGSAPGGARSGKTVGQAPRRANDEPLRLVVPPVLGRPHPASPGEQLLAEWLARDAELGPLFAFNQPVETTSSETFVADLLWPAGKLAVEVDGYTWHSGPHAFAADRYRDYRLLCEGYRTLRLPHDEVMDDPALQLEKIRDVVRAIRKEK